MKYQLGYQDDPGFVRYLLSHKDNISEIYFPWGNFATGRFTGQ